MNAARQKLWIAFGAAGLLGAGLAARRMGRTRRTAPAFARERAPSLPQASTRDTLLALLDVFLPNVAKGVIVRRPALVNLSERMEQDRRAVRRMQNLRSKYGDGPLMLRLPLRNQALLFEPAHVRRVLEGSPDPFDPASSEKVAALSHLEPQGVLISRGEDRTVRRHFNEEVLDYRHDVHRLVDSFLPVVEQEAARMLAAARRQDCLDWPAFEEGWARMVRRVTFGAAAADDSELDSLALALRRAANWAFLHPPMRRTRRRFLARIRHYLDLAEPGSLAGLAATIPQDTRTAPEHQVAQWLFAFDPAGMGVFRALALLATHPEQAARAQQEIRAHPDGERRNLPLLRATVLEALRLWPTTPLLLRQTRRETLWEHGVMPARTGILIHTPTFHRDDQRLPYADRYTPELWMRERSAHDWPLIPFSAGPATCPAHHLVPLLGSAMLAALLDGRSFRLQEAQRIDPQRLPGTLDNYALRFAFAG